MGHIFMKGLVIIYSFSLMHIVYWSFKKEKLNPGVTFVFLSLSFTASSECQAHGVRQLANADGDDVEVTPIRL